LLCRIAARFHDWRREGEQLIAALSSAPSLRASCFKLTVTCKEQYVLIFLGRVSLQELNLA